MTYQSAIYLGYQQITSLGSAAGLTLPVGPQVAQATSCSLSGKLLTVGGAVTGAFAVGQVVVGTGIPANTTIVQPATLQSNPTTWWLSNACSTESGETVTAYQDAGTNVAEVSVEGAAVRWRADGTAPTTTVGQPLAAGASQRFTSLDLQALQIIQQTAAATLDVYYYRVPSLG